MTEKRKTSDIRGKVLALFVLIAAGMCAAGSMKAQGDLLIFPKRVVFDGKKKVEKLLLSNIGGDTSTYNISFIQRRMTESGKLEPINEPDSGQRFATSYLRVFPRMVTLAPSETQIVKVQVSRTGTIEDGEYRSHLLFMPEKETSPLGQENKDADTTKVTVKLEPVFGISIPTIIRKGTPNTFVSISNLEYTLEDDSQHFLSFRIHRSGNMSTYGDIVIHYISDDNTSYEIGKASGLAVYTPGTVREVKMQLKKPADADFNTGKFRIRYTEHKGEEVIAEAEQRND